MVKSLSRYWWLFLLRGIIAAFVGILLIAWPGLSLEILIMIYGIFALVGGIFSMILSLVGIGSNKNWWVLFLEGLLGLVIGWIVLEWPILTVYLLARIMVWWALISGTLQILVAIFARKEVKNETYMILSGVLSLIFGLLLVSQPIASIIVLSWIIGFYAMFFGILFIVFSFQIKDYAGKN